MELSSYVCNFCPATRMRACCPTFPSISTSRPVNARIRAAWPGAAAGRRGVVIRDSPCANARNRSNESTRISGTTAGWFAKRRNAQAACSPTDSGDLPRSLTDANIIGTSPKSPVMATTLPAPRARSFRAEPSARARKYGRRSVRVPPDARGRARAQRQGTRGNNLDALELFPVDESERPPRHVVLGREPSRNLTAALGSESRALESEAYLDAELPKKIAKRRAYDFERLAPGRMGTAGKNQGGLSPHVRKRHERRAHERQHGPIGRHFEPMLPGTHRPRFELDRVFADVSPLDAHPADLGKKADALGVKTKQSWRG